MKPAMLPREAKRLRRLIISRHKPKFGEPDHTKLEEIPPGAATLEMTEACQFRRNYGHVLKEYLRNIRRIIFNLPDFI